VYVVAIMESQVGALDGAESLARTLGEGISALDVRMALSATPPRVLLRTPSRERAESAARTLVERGLAAIAVDLSTVLPVDRMVHVHRVALDEAGLRADPGGPTLAYSDLGVIVRVAAETAIWRTTREKELHSVRGRGVLVEVEHTRTERAFEQAAFLFARGGGVPWVMRAGEARYLGLGEAMRRTTTENVLTVVEQLRERAPRAAYDERFVADPLVRHADTHVRDNDHAPPELGDAGLELRVQLLAWSLGCARP